MLVPQLFFYIKQRNQVKPILSQSDIYECYDLLDFISIICYSGV